MVNLVLETITKYNLIESGDKIVLGVSGGPDSISMLNILYNLKKENKLDIEIYVAHVNHGIRENAKIDEQYVKEYCENNNISFYDYILECEGKDIINLKDIKKEYEASLPKGSTHSTVVQTGGTQAQVNEKEKIPFMIE